MSGGATPNGTPIATVRVHGRRRPTVILREQRGRQDNDTTVELEFEDGTFIGFLHLRAEPEGVVAAYWELSDEVEEPGLPRAESGKRLIYVRRKQEAARG